MERRVDPHSDLHPGIGAGLPRLSLAVRHQAQGVARSGGLESGRRRGRLTGKRLVTKEPDPAEHRAIGVTLTARDARVASRLAL